MTFRSVCGAGLVAALVAVGTDAVGQTPKTQPPTKPGTTTPTKPAPKFGVAPPAGPAVGIAPPVAPPPPIRLGVDTLPATGGGLYIRTVFDGYPAKVIGLESGDVLVSINGRATNTADEMRSAIDQAITANAGQVTLLVKDIRGTGFVNLSATLVCEMVPMPGVGAAAPAGPPVFGAAPKNKTGATASAPAPAAPRMERKVTVANVRRSPATGTTTPPPVVPKKK